MLLQIETNKEENKMKTLNKEIRQVELRFDRAIMGITEFLANRRNIRPFVIAEKTTNSFKEFKQEVENNNGMMIISSEGCEKTIYGNAYLNILARAWHDEIHLAHNLDFSMKDEFLVSDIQSGQLRNSTEDVQLGDDMATIIELDIKGQVIYYDRYKEFVDNQLLFVKRLFIVKCLNVSSSVILDTMEGKIR